MCSFKRIFILACLICFRLHLLQAQEALQYSVQIKKSYPAIRTPRLNTGTTGRADGESFGYTDKYLLHNEKAWFPVMGEMHFSRCREQDWEKEILAMKAGGIQIISTYVIWVHHEMKEGFFNWEGNRNLSHFLSLCKKHGMYVWLRPGPWVHAEVRNGGFPDWLMRKKIGLRSNDSVYLQYVKIFFHEIAQQCRGYYFKQGGPVIGIQTENELQYTGGPAFLHMKTLKQMIINEGMDVPYYSAFAKGPDNQDDFLYMIGSYPDSPWSNSTKKLFKPVYFIRPLQSDADIGTDLLGKLDVNVKNYFPLLSAEIGGGMQVTYHRRVVVSAKDVAANAFVKIASGLNGLGYYMYHGGINPVDTVNNVALQESRVSGYPNDVPLINYDFQAPLGSMGIQSPAFNELKLLNFFLQDYGSWLATDLPYFPKKRKENMFSSDTVQCSVRAKEGAGFIFLSNYQRLVHLPSVNHFQLQVFDDEKKELVPHQPVTFPSNHYAVWPYNLVLDDVKVKYATVQPLYILHRMEANTYVFFSDSILPQILLDHQSIRSVKLINGCHKDYADSNQIVGDAMDKAFYLEVKNKNGRQVNFLVLTKEQALLSNKIKTPKGNEAIAILDGVLRQNDTGICIETKNREGKIRLQFFPSIKPDKASNTFTCKQISYNKIFSTFEIAPGTINKPSVTYSRVMNANRLQASLFRDSVIRKYQESANFNKLQTGPLYQTQFHALPDQSVYQLQFNYKPSACVTQWEAVVNYNGDVLAMYHQNKIVYDQFNYNGICKFRINDLLKNEGKELLMQLLPLPANSDIYIPDLPGLKTPVLYSEARLKKIDLYPLYQYTLNFNN